MTEPMAHDDRRKETIIATTAVIGLLLTYLIYRRSANMAAGGGAAASAPPVVNNPNSDGTQQLLTGILGAQQTLSGQLGQLVNNTTPATSTGSTTPSTPPRSMALFHFSDLHGQTPTLQHLAQMIYGIATPGNVNALQKANPGFKYAGGHSGGGTLITGINRNTGVQAPVPQLPLATVQHVVLSPVSSHTPTVPAQSVNPS